MELIKREDLSFGKTGWRARLQSALLSWIAARKQINQLYNATFPPSSDAELKPLQGIGATYTLTPHDQMNLPATGAAILIANHPSGALEGLILIDLLYHLRPDVKFMGNFLLRRIDPLKRFFIDVDPFESAQRSSVGGLRQSLAHLQAGGLLVIFPAGEVATWQQGFGHLQDRVWPSSIMRFIRKAQVPVVPMYIELSNSLLFHLAGKIHPLLRTALIPRELLRKRGRCVTLRCGSPIAPKRTEELSERAYADFMRASVAYLRPMHESRLRKMVPRKTQQREPDQLREEIPSAQLIEELGHIRETCRLFASGGYEIFCAPPDVIPQMMIHIGTMREKTFREIGEGTRNEIDTDRFDSYYHQLFIWDNDASRLVGAYRLGLGDQIMERYGLEGFYTHTLFRMRPPMEEVMRQTIELGRSFIVREYQRKPASLLLLWKGILYLLLRHEQFRYLMGPVTISGEFHDASKQIIASFIERCYGDRQKMSYITPRTGMKLHAPIDTSLLREIRSIELINKLVTDIEQDAFSVPVLIRKYLQLNSNVLGFNTDHDFCDGLDALMLLDLYHVPDHIIQMLSKELAECDVIGRFRKMQA